MNQQDNAQEADPHKDELALRKAQRSPDNFECLLIPPILLIQQFENEMKRGQTPYKVLVTCKKVSSENPLPSSKEI